MTDDSPIALMRGRWRPLRLATLVRLRWLALAGQAFGIVFVHWGLNYPLPLAACLSLIALSVVVNLAVTLRWSAGERPSAGVIAAQLGYDLCQLGGLLFLTGGLENPFSLLLIAPVSVSASSLPSWATVSLAGVAVAMASLVGVWHLPLPWERHGAIAFERVYVVGIWVSLVCGVVFVAAYTHRVAHEARQLTDALTATELALSRHEQLSALDGLAAAAAHELATPLATIAVTAKEMRSEIPAGPLADDAALIVAQTARCRAILQKLGNLKRGDDGNPFAVVPLSALLAEVVQPYGGGRPILLDVPKAGDEPLFARSIGVLHGLDNLVANASQFARTRVDVAARWSPDEIAITIADDGPGFADELMARLGEPYLTSRPRNAAPEAQAPGGLGLGIFIAVTLLERSSARLDFGNSRNGGAVVRIVWPRRRR